MATQELLKVWRKIMQGLEDDTRQGELSEEMDEMMSHSPYITGQPLCPKCDTALEYYAGIDSIPAYLYCPSCNDTAYSPDNPSQVIGRIE